LKAYFDSALLVKLYIQEENSRETIQLVQSFEPPILFTHLHATEIKNALRLKCYRKEITPVALAQSIKAIEADLKVGALETSPIDWVEMFRQADALSERYALQTNCRTLDVFHVACALILKADTFVSYDIRQRAVAKKSGMDVEPGTK
jgi:predicted nucleic acid-binding protein